MIRVSYWVVEQGVDVINSQKVMLSEQDKGGKT